MSEPFLAEIRIVGFNFPPRGWALCDGQILPINQNQSLYSLLGTTYGGDGRTDFALPDLRGRAPIHPGSAQSESPVDLGQRGGANTVALDASELPAHTHGVEASAEPASAKGAAGQVLAKQARFAPDLYAPPNDLVALDPASVTTAGGGQGHENRQPYLALNFVIALTGLFPSRN